MARELAANLATPMLQLANANGEPLRRRDSPPGIAFAERRRARACDRSERSWLRKAWPTPAATGSPAQCVATIREQFALGADGVILHGASPAELAPIVDEYKRTA